MADKDEKDKVVAPRRKPQVSKSRVLEKKVREQQAALEKLQETLEQQAKMQQALIAGQLGAGQHVRAATGQKVVGVRNVSNYSVGLTDRTGPLPVEYNLHPASEKMFIPQSQMVIPYVFWQQLRQGALVRRGMIVRDDSVLASHDIPGPEDRPEDIPAEAAINVIDHARQWILETPEAEIRARIAKMTSTPTLRKLMRAVDLEILDIGEERYKGLPDRAEKSINDLPSVFRTVEELCKSRIDALEPTTKDPSFMTTVLR